MKKVKILAVILAAITVLTLALSFSASAVEYSTFNETNRWKVNLGDKVNVLAGNVGLLESQASNFELTDVMTDGWHFGNSGDPEAFFNKKVFANKDSGAEAEGKPGAYEFKMTDGKTVGYQYKIVWSDVYADVNSFDIYFCGSDKYATPGYHLPCYQIDAEFDILVSTDGGETWDTAWQSVRFATDPNSSAIVTAMAGFTENEGVGNAVEVKVTDPADPTAVLATYRVISGEFAKEYKNVTNIAYAASKIRRDGRTDDSNVDAEGNLVERQYIPYAYTQNWCSRISEFEVFGKLNEKPATTPAPETTKKPETTAKPETTTKPETTNTPVSTVAPAPETTKVEEKKGCGSVASIGVAVIVTVLGSAIIRKKH